MSETAYILLEGLGLPLGFCRAGHQFGLVTPPYWPPPDQAAPQAHHSPALAPSSLKCSLKAGLKDLIPDLSIICSTPILVPGCFQALTEMSKVAHFQALCPHSALLTLSPQVSGPALLAGLLEGLNRDFPGLEGSSISQSVILS